MYLSGKGKERKTMLEIKDVLDVVLQDDVTPYGGIGFANETVKDFAIELGLDLTDSIEDLNEALTYRLNCATFHFLFII